MSPVPDVTETRNIGVQPMDEDYEAAFDGYREDVVDWTDDELDEEATRLEDEGSLSTDQRALLDAINAEANGRAQRNLQERNV